MSEPGLDTTSDARSSTSAAPLLEIEDLHVRFQLREGDVKAVNGVSLSIPAKGTIGLVGESGCGKSVTAKTILRILPRRAQIDRGRILLHSSTDAGQPPTDLVQLDSDSKEMRRIRGGDISMIFQEPMTSLSPVHTVGNQIMESVRLHQGKTGAEARDVAVEMLRLVHVPMAEQRVDTYPHQLSGGLRQRCMIAMALASQPRILIADEPTTALDVTIQAQILELIEQLQKTLNMAVVMITHDLGVIAETADQVAVMYLGRIVEQGSVDSIFNDPKHPYTRGLLASLPRIGQGNENRLTAIPGTVPDGGTIPRGCPFHPRCHEFKRGVCDTESVPRLEEVAPGHQTACFLYEPCISAKSGSSSQEVQGGG